MGDKTLTLEATIKGLKAGQYLADPTAAENFSFQDVVHLIVEENSGVTEISGCTTEEQVLELITAEWNSSTLPEFFALNMQLKSLDLSGVENIEAYAFYVSKLEKIRLKNDRKINIEDYAFMANQYLMDVVIQAKGGDLAIGEQAFRGCFLLGTAATRSVVLTGENIKIGKEAFLLPHRLKDVTLEGTVEEVGADAFASASASTPDHGMISEDIVIHYASGAEEFATKCPEGKLENVGLTKENFAA